MDRTELSNKDADYKDWEVYLNNTAQRRDLVVSASSETGQVVRYKADSGGMPMEPERAGGKPPTEEALGLVKIVYNPVDEIRSPVTQIMPEEAKADEKAAVAEAKREARRQHAE
jgi:hypothetical protein